MTLRTIFRLRRGRQLAALAAVQLMQRAYYRLCFLAGLADAGLLAKLSAGSMTPAEIAAALAPIEACEEGLRAWLDFGVRLRVLRRNEQGYELRGWLARSLAHPDRDAVLALVQETSGLHHALITDSLPRLRAGRLFTLGDQRGEIIARSSRILEPFVCEAIDALLPRSGKPRLFEVGCGSGVYLRHAATSSSGLTAVGLELQADVAALARENLRRWGVADRVTVEVGDVRTRTPEPVFDLATLHNNIYYFPVDERPALLEHVQRFLRPGGLLLITTACQGGSAAVEMLNLWAAMTAGCGRLPARAELERQLREAGYTEVRSRSLIPTDRFYAFIARAGVR
jgi:SAM-dependent methyltransferase